MRLAHRWWIYLVCALGIFVALVAYRAQWSYSEFPSTFTADSLAYPASIDDLPADSPERLRFLAESWPPGSTISIIDAHGANHPLTLVLRQGGAALVLTGLSGLVFLIAAVAIFAPRSTIPGAGGFLCISFLYGLSIMVGGVFFPRENTVWLTAFGLIQIMCLTVLPAAFVHLALTFPRRSAFLDRQPWFGPTLGGCAVVVFVWQAVVLLRFFRAPTLTNGAELAPAFTAADIYLVALMLAGMLIFALRARGLTLTRERNQVSWLLWGFAIGAAPYVLLRTVPTLIGAPPLVPAAVDRVVELAIPFAFTMAVVRHQFLDIDVIIRRSLLYGLLAAVLVGVYLVAGILFARNLKIPEGIAPWIQPLILGLGAGVAFLPVRRTLGRWIDRTFFKLTYDRDQVLDAFDRHLASLATRQPVATAVLELVTRVLPAQPAAVVIRRTDGSLRSIGLDGDEAGRILEDAVARCAEKSGFLAAPSSTSLPDLEDAGFPTSLREAGIVLAQPLVIQVGVAGLILLGSRATERRYVQPDLDFLAGCARLVGQHLERIGLMQAVAEESLARERLVELDRLKSDFLSHVAHDLRTPVTGIAWSARNLGDGMAGELTPEQARYVQSIARSGEHLDRLVSNLLEISRMDQSETALSLAAVDPVAVWRQSVYTIAPLALAKSVAVVIVGAEHAAPIQANGDKLAEIAVNLLDNAIKYTAPDTTVTVEFHAPDDGSLAVSVRDQGPGLGGQLPETLYGRFAQGEPSPSSSRKGFGLGLHIVVTYLELMGGRLTATDQDEGGAVFTCRLPLAVSAPPRHGEGEAP